MIRIEEESNEGENKLQAEPRIQTRGMTQKEQEVSRKIKK